MAWALLTLSLNLPGSPPPLVPDAVFKVTLAAAAVGAAQLAVDYTYEYLNQRTSVGEKSVLDNQELQQRLVDQQV